MKSKNDIAISVKGRFEIFDIASEINKNGRLYCLFSSYPKFFLRKYNIEDEKIYNYPLIEVLSRIFDSLISRSLRFQIIDYILVSIFEKLVISKIKIKSNFKYFIGQSAFSYETFKFLKENLPRKKIILYVASTHIDEKIEILRLKKTQIVSEIYYKKIKKEYEIADYIICQSSHVQKSFIKRGFKNIYLNVSGVDINNFYYKKINIFDKNYFNILFVGNINKRKGVPELIKLFKKLKIKNKRLYLIGPKNKDLEIDSYLNEEIKYLGKKEYNQLYKYYSNADLMCLFSKEEGFSMVLGQCLSCGTPLIGSSVSGAQHFIKNPSYGYVYREFNEKNIINKINLIHENLEIIRSNKKNLSSKFKLKHSWERSVTNLLKTIDKFI